MTRQGSRFCRPCLCPFSTASQNSSLPHTCTVPDVERPCAFQHPCCCPSHSPCCAVSTLKKRSCHQGTISAQPVPSSSVAVASAQHLEQAGTAGCLLLIHAAADSAAAAAAAAGEEHGGGRDAAAAAAAAVLQAEAGQVLVAAAVAPHRPPHLLLLLCAKPSQPCWCPTHHSAHGLEGR